MGRRAVTHKETAPPHFLLILFRLFSSHPVQVTYASFSVLRSVGLLIPISACHLCPSCLAPSLPHIPTRRLPSQASPRLSFSTLSSTFPSLCAGSALVFVPFHQCVLPFTLCSVLSSHQHLVPFQFFCLLMLFHHFIDSFNKFRLFSSHPVQVTYASFSVLRTRGTSRPFTAKGNTRCTVYMVSLQSLP
ncbi:hypothetical protein BCR44DRAFT_222552 [Catenaria anguillulae PL171]|uniref:Uncharacterized protein n=1 Tax=Catenaria anguillulae PL171 TaxID=765915 RepID=A0A1Y2HCM1_9FUNG|nr:hypothetical protein BCR44DRAFT_222552 [Catenaria anguillulae PL171]